MRGNSANKDFAANKKALASHLNQHLSGGCDGIYVIEVATGKVKHVALVDDKAVWTTPSEGLAHVIRSYF